jgi:hypothetical protein
LEREKTVTGIIFCKGWQGIADTAMFRLLHIVSPKTAKASKHYVTGNGRCERVIEIAMQKTS